MNRETEPRERFVWYLTALSISLCLGLFRGWSLGKNQIQKDAIRAGAAEYRIVTNTTDRVEFVWKGQQ